MNCRRFEEELEKLGALKALETDPALGEHLKICPDCQTKHSEYSRLFEMLATDQLPQPDDAYWASFPALVHKRIEKTQARPRWKPVLGWSLPAAALILVVGITLFVSKDKPNLANLTAEEAFSYNEVNSETAVAAQAEDELVGTLNVEELVYTLSEEQLKTLEEKLTDFKL